MEHMNKIRAFSFSILVFSLFLSILVSYAAPVNKEEPKMFDITSQFVASGWMGDGEYGRKYLIFDGAHNINPHSPPSCIKIVYTFGPHGWGGIYWHNKPDNWGDEPGIDLQKANYRKLTFWARGEEGGEIVEFKAGGIRAPVKKYIDSFEVSTGRVVLEKEWKEYVIDLQEKNLSSVIGGFCWVASRDYNRSGLTFYLDDVRYEQ
jgi:hypothetical protein